MLYLSPEQAVTGSASQTPGSGSDASILYPILGESARQAHAEAVQNAIAEAKAKAAAERAQTRARALKALQDTEKARVRLPASTVYHPPAGAGVGKLTPQ